MTHSLGTWTAGGRGQLFWLALKTSVWTVLTLGIYRFWMKTRLRRWYWSSVRPGGVPLEYVGDPLEKLLGFLIAVTFLAFYIGLVNLILMFASFAIFPGNVTAYVLSFLGLIPFYFYARYRARRYILARTRWRGIRFGLAPGAWGYAWRAMVHWLITIITLGLLWPRMTFWLEKYRTDRSFFGSQRLHQGGRWQMLYRPFLPMLIGVVLTIAASVAQSSGIFIARYLIVASVPLTLWGFVNYRVNSFKLLANQKSAGDIGFHAKPRVSRVLGIYLLGGFFVYFSLVLLLLGIGVAFFAAAAVYAPNLDALAEIQQVMARLPWWLSVAVGLGGYFSFFIFWGVLSHVFLTLPLIRHYADTLELRGTEALSRIDQRARDEFAEAEGFAEALDVGAAI